MIKLQNTTRFPMLTLSSSHMTIWRSINLIICREMFKRANVLALLWLAAIFISILILESKLKNMERTNCLVENPCEETRVATAPVPARSPDDTKNSGPPSAFQRARAPSGGTVPNEDFYSGKNDTNFSMENPEFLEYLRREILVPPVPMPYNLDDPLGDPTALEGQYKVILNLLKNKRNGLFLEAGAHQGEYLSNTLVLERDFGWTGLLVEPDEVAFGQLLSKHRKAWAASVCLSPNKRPEKLEFVYNRRYPVVSHLAGRSLIKENLKDLDAKVVRCIPVFSLLIAVNMTEVDYFSLDVEGAELDVLKTIPFDRVTIRTLSVEFDHIMRVPGRDEELLKLMRDNGFRLVTLVTTGLAKDFIFAHSSVQ